MTGVRRPGATRQTSELIAVEVQPHRGAASLGQIELAVQRDLTGSHGHERTASGRSGELIGAHRRRRSSPRVEVQTARRRRCGEPDLRVVVVCRKHARGEHVLSTDEPLQVARVLFEAPPANASTAESAPPRAVRALTSEKVTSTAAASVNGVSVSMTVNLEAVAGPALVTSGRCRRPRHRAEDDAGNGTLPRRMDSPRRILSFSLARGAGVDAKIAVTGPLPRRRRNRRSRASVHGVTLIQMSPSVAALE